MVKVCKKNCVLFFLISCVFSSSKIHTTEISRTSLSSTSLQYPLLITAILKKDPGLYTKEMGRLLNGPVIDFIRAVYFIAGSGDTIFRLMARVQSHRDFFYNELKNLHNFLFPKEFIFLENISLGGIKMTKPGYLEETDIGKAILSQNIEAILNESDKLQEGSAIELFQVLHARTRANESYITFIKRNLSSGQLMVVWDQVLFTAEIKRYIGEDRISLFATNSTDDISLYIKAKIYADFLAENEKKMEVPGWEFFGIFSAFYGVSLISDEYLSLIAHLHPEKITWGHASDMPLLILAGMLEWVVYSGIGSFIIQKCRKAFTKKKSPANALDGT